MGLGWAEIPEPSLVKEDLNVKERGRCLTEPRPGDQEERGTSQRIRLTLTVPISAALEGHLEKSQLGNSTGESRKKKSWGLKKKKKNLQKYSRSVFGRGDVVCLTLKPLLSSPVPSWGGSAGPSPAAGG